MRPTFSGFYIAKQGLDAARANLQVTGQNMTNAGTKGYTRQRVDTYAVGASTSDMRYATRESYIGEGVRIGGISQLRDPYLDVRYRREHAKFGETQARYEGLNDLDDLLNKTQTERISDQMSNLVTQLRELAKTPGDPVAESIVKTSATMLMQMFNNTAGQIKKIKNEQTSALKDGAITDANYFIANIAQLNEAIKSANVSGNPALELMDARNMMIDELSRYVPIETSTKLIDVGEGTMIEELSINMIAPNGDKFNLVNNGEFRQFQIIEATGTNPDIGIKLIESNGTAVESSDGGSISLTGGNVGVHIDRGAFVGALKVLNNKGEFGNPPSQDRGIGYYEGMMDTVANKLATMMNDANGADKPLFVSTDGGPITAGNVVISPEWQKSSTGYITSRRRDPVTGIDDENEGSNILYMIAQFTEKQKFETPVDPNDPNSKAYPLFTGSFHEALTHVSTTLGLEVSSVKRQHTASVSNMGDVDNQRNSVSGVNIDEEGINLIMYNQALTAASRYMTTLDEAVETIISKMGIVGR